MNTRCLHVFVRVVIIRIRIWEERGYSAQGRNSRCHQFKDLHDLRALGQSGERGYQFTDIATGKRVTLTNYGLKPVEKKNVPGGQRRGAGVQRSQGARRHAV